MGHPEERLGIATRKRRPERRDPAGNLLGAEQSGFVHAVGFDLYLRMLEETVRRLMSGDAAPKLVPADVTIDTPNYLPDDYVVSQDAKIDVYKRLARFTEPADVDHVLIFFGQFFEKVMFVTLRLQIDISLRALQRPEVTFHILYIRIGVQQETDHECRVENSSASLLLGKI